MSMQAFSERYDTELEYPHTLRVREMSDGLIQRLPCTECIHAVRNQTGNVLGVVDRSGFNILCGQRIQAGDPVIDLSGNNQGDTGLMLVHPFMLESVQEGVYQCVDFSQGRREIPIKWRDYTGVSDQKDIYQNF